MHNPARYSGIGVAVALGTIVAVGGVLRFRLALAGPLVVGGPDEFYNVIRGLRVLVEAGNPAYFIHPALYYDLLAGAYAAYAWVGHLTGRFESVSGLVESLVRDERPLVLLSRSLTAAISTATIPLAYACARTLSGRIPALWGAAALALMPLHVANADRIRVDTLSIFWMLVSMAMFVRVARAPTRRNGVLTGVSLGLAAASNYNLGLLPLSLVFLPAPRDEDSAWRWRGEISLIAVVVFLVTNPFVLLDWDRFLHWFRFQASMAFAPHPYSELHQGAGYYLEVLSKGHAVLAAAGASVGVACLVLGRREDRIVALFPVLYGVMLFFFRSKYERFLLPVLVPYCALLPAAWERWGPRGPWKRLPVALAAVAILWEMGGHVPRPPVEERSRTAEREMLDWLVRHAAPRSVILYESDALPLTQATFDPPGGEGRLQALMREAFREVFSTFDLTFAKSQLVGEVYNYSPELLRDGSVDYVVMRPSTRTYVVELRPDLEEVRDFYRVLEEEGKIEFRAGGRDGLIVYRVSPSDQLQ